MFKETGYPMRILTALKRFWLGLGERGETQVSDPPPAPADWKAALPDEIKADPIFEKYKEPGEAFKALVEAQKFLGREKLPVPKDENDKETFDLIFKRLGLPEKEDGYQLPTDLQIPKELPFDEVMAADFKKVAHQHRLLPSQVSGLYKWYMTTMIESFNKYGDQKKASAQEAEAALRKKTGAAYSQTIALAKKVVERFLSPQAYAKIDQTGWGNDPDLIEAFSEIGKILSEDQLSGKPKSFTLTSDEAQIEINKIKSDMKHPYWDETNPVHKEAVANMERLLKLTMVG